MKRMHPVASATNRRRGFSLIELLRHIKILYVGPQYLNTEEFKERLFKPKGFDGQKKYKVTFDNTGETKIIEGSELLQKGLSIEIENPRSELLLFEQL